MRFLSENHDALSCFADDNIVLPLRKLGDMERLQFYFRGHTDAVAYLKKINAI